MRRQLRPGPARGRRPAVQHRRRRAHSAGGRQPAADARPTGTRSPRRCPTGPPAIRRSCTPRRTAARRSPGRAIIGNLGGQRQRDRVRRRPSRRSAWITDTMTGGTFFQSTPAGRVHQPRLNLGDQGPDEAYDGRLALDGNTPVAEFQDLSDHIFIREYNGTGDINSSSSWSVARSTGRATRGWSAVRAASGCSTRRRTPGRCSSSGSSTASRRARRRRSRRTATSTTPTTRSPRTPTAH